MNTLVLFGANKYGAGLGGARSQGCLRDLRAIYDWTRANRFRANAINVVVLDDERDTRTNLWRAFDAAAKSAVSGEWIWAHDSSHGTQISVNGKTKGALCHYDSDFSRNDTFTTADDFYSLAAAVKHGVQIFMTIDACEFGDSVRAIQPAMYAPSVSANRIETPRWIAPSFGHQIEIEHNESNGGAVESFIPRGIKNVTSIAGCQQGKTCADVQDTSGAHGAFTSALVKYLNDGKASKISSETSNDLAADHFEQRPVFSGFDAPKWIPV